MKWFLFMDQHSGGAFPLMLEVELWPIRKFYACDCAIISQTSQFLPIHTLMLFRLRQSKQHFQTSALQALRCSLHETRKIVAKLSSGWQEQQVTSCLIYSKGKEPVTSSITLTIHFPAVSRLMKLETDNIYMGKYS